MRKTTKIAAVALAAALGCSVLAGCDLVSTNLTSDYEQVIAEVNIASSAQFTEDGYGDYKDAIQTTEITKLEMVAYFVTTGYSAMQQNGWTYRDTFEMVAETLTNRAVYIQYAMAYLLKNGDAEGGQYTMDGLNAAVDAAKQAAEAEGRTFTEADRTLATIGSFLDEDEKALALYRTRMVFNNTIDTQEESIIAAEESSSSDETVRTLPTGVDTENAEYFDPLYNVYTGYNTLASCGSYEAPEGSTPSTRQRAYSAFLANLRSNNLIGSRDNVMEFEKLSYFNIELRSAYEDRLIQKLNEKFEQEAVADLTEEVVQSEFNAVLARQKDAFSDPDTGEETFETALDGMGDESFVLTAPAAGYGYVVNILLPFSASQSQKLEDHKNDYDDAAESVWKEKKFACRAELLKDLRATDQRGTWMTGETDHSFTSDSGYTNGNDGRSLLFFEDGISENSRYERIPNYLGKYTYNGVYNAEKKVATPNHIDVDAFIAEMKGYLQSEAVQGALSDGESFSVSGNYVGSIADDGVITPASDKEDYFTRAVQDYYKQDTDGNETVDQSKFIYYAGEVDFGGGFNANEMFLAGSAENVVYSAINELSFAYNTDTAGLNTYLGYAVSIGDTDYVDEFEYAAQYVCKQGAGNYVVVATDYGWHIIYCTFSFMEDSLEPFSYDDALKETEGTFSYLFYEALRADIAEQYTNVQQTKALNRYIDCKTLYEDRYQDLLSLDSSN